MAASEKRKTCKAVITDEIIIDNIGKSLAKFQLKVINIF